LVPQNYKNKRNLQALNLRLHSRVKFLQMPS
jgi:hypothetical protein